MDALLGCISILTLRRWLIVDQEYHRFLLKYLALHPLISENSDNFNVILTEIIPLIKYVITNVTMNDLNSGLFEACKNNNRDLIKLLIMYGADNWDWGLDGACRGGHIHLVQIMINNGATDLGRGLQSACRNGDYSIVNFMIKSIENVRCLSQSDVDLGMCGACQGGHKELVNKMVNLGAKDWNMGLCGACEFGHPDLVKMMFNYSGHLCDNYYAKQWIQPGDPANLHALFNEEEPDCDWNYFKHYILPWL